MAGPSGATPRLALPYPISTDTADVPRDVKALADKLETVKSLGVPVLTTLPVAPVDGDEIYLMASVSAPWHLRYYASRLQWLPLGGVPLQADVAALENTSSMAYQDLATVGPSIVVPVRGQYIVSFGAIIRTAAQINNAGVVSYSAGSTPASDLDSATAQTPAAASMAASVARVARTGTPPLNAGDTIRMKYRDANGGAAGISTRWLTVEPLYLGAY